MARVYDNWESLVGATLRREELRIIALRTPSELSFSSESSLSSFPPPPPRRLPIFDYPSSSPFFRDDSITYSEILGATDNFRHSNLIKKGHNGNLFYGTLHGVEVVVRQVDTSSWFVDRGPLSLLLTELEIFGRHPRFLVPLVGYCFEDMNYKCLVYKYMPNKDLSNCLFRKDHNFNLVSLNWKTRLKIAIGAAKGLRYLHYECNPPLVHRDVQASSILLDDKFQVWLGSLSEVCISEENQEGTPSAMSSYDVYCFGKVLLGLVTGNLGFSGAKESKNMKDGMAKTLTYVDLSDAKLILEIVDPTLVIIDEDVLMEVWAVSIIAKRCLNPRPCSRPPMLDVLLALENPSTVVNKKSTKNSIFRWFNW